MSRAVARRRRSASGDEQSLGARVASEMLGVTLIGLSLLGALALATYSADDPVLRLAPVSNAAGVVGAALAAGLQRSVGLGSVVLVVSLGIVGLRLVLGRGLPPPASRVWIGLPLLVVSVAMLPTLLESLAPGRAPKLGGGAVGALLAGRVRALLGQGGALLLSGLLLCVGALSVTGVSTGQALGGGARASAWLGSLLGRGLQVLALACAEAVRALARGVRALVSAVLAGVAGLRRAAVAVAVWRERRARRARVSELRGAETPAGEEPPSESGLRLPRLRARSAEPTIVDHRAEQKARSAPRQEAFSFRDRAATTPFRLPEVGLFQKPPESARSYDRSSLVMNSRILEKKLLDFGVAGRVVAVHPGPVITMYEFEPASGVKVNRIVSLADDLALALRALSVRIIAPLPGKSVVGIEVPNAEREVVYIRDLLESETLRVHPSRLAVALGKDIFGNPVDTDLAKMPHLLVAGATGTGKSVFLNALLCSILFRAHPDELRLLLIDPKLLELSVYDGIPHLIAEVVTNPKRAAAALGGIVRKMEERYQMMAALGVRSIDQFNDRVDQELAAGHTTFRLKAKPGETEGKEAPLERLPYIVVVIDELADLMVVSARDVEESLQRLAQMARAAGIHLVLATQRPSVDVLTGIIKANFPARISFQVSSRTDSRTILDHNGAEHLLGQGDMLFLPPGTSKLKRIHGAYVSEKEVGELVAFLRDQGSPDFDETLLRMREESEAKEARGEDVDEMYDKAIALVAETRNASISWVQRRLKVGYNRAARMVEQMEQEGIVGPQDGTKPREVYARPLELE